MRHPKLSIVLTIIFLIGFSGGADATSRPGVTPAAIHIATANVLAPVVLATIENGTPESPHCTSAVSYYEETGRLGVAGNVIMAGANDWPGIDEPAVFAQLGSVQNGDVIEVVGDDSKIYRFEVVKVQEYATKAEVPIAEVFRDPKDEKLLTIVTGAGAFDEAIGDYVGALVVMAQRTKEKATLPAEPSVFAGLTVDPACLSS